MKGLSIVMILFSRFVRDPLIAIEFFIFKSSLFEI